MFVMKSLERFTAVVSAPERMEVLLEPRHDPAPFSPGEFHLKVATVTGTADQIYFARRVHRCMQRGFHNEYGTVDWPDLARLLDTPNQITACDRRGRDRAGLPDIAIHPYCFVEADSGVFRCGCLTDACCHRQKQGNDQEDPYGGQIPKCMDLGNSWPRPGFGRTLPSRRRSPYCCIFHVPSPFTVPTDAFTVNVCRIRGNHAPL